MATSYSAVATKPEEIVSCTALTAGDYPAEFSAKVDKIVADIKDDSLKAKVKQTLGCFEKGSAGNLIQSSPYRLVVLQSLLPQGKRLATIPRLRIARGNDSNFMSGFSVDGGLNLVPYEDRKDNAINPVQANKLELDLLKTGVDVKNAKLIPYHILTPQVDGKSPSGLVFRLSKEGKDIAKQVIVNTDDFQWNYKPSQGGLFRAYLNYDGNWYCVNRDLEYSYGYGGVVVESAEGVVKK